MVQFPKLFVGIGALSIMLAAATFASGDAKDEKGGKEGKDRAPAAKAPDKPSGGGARQPDRPQARPAEKPQARQPERPQARQPERPQARQPERPQARQPERPQARQPDRPQPRPEAKPQPRPSQNTPRTETRRPESPPSGDRPANPGVSPNLPPAVKDRLRDNTPPSRKPDVDSKAPSTRRPETTPGPDNRSTRPDAGRADVNRRSDTKPPGLGDRKPDATRPGLDRLPDKARPDQRPDPSRPDVGDRRPDATRPGLDRRPETNRPEIDRDLKDSIKRNELRDRVETRKPTAPGDRTPRVPDVGRRDGQPDRGVDRDRTNRPGSDRQLVQPRRIAPDGGLTNLVDRADAAVSRDFERFKDARTPRDVREAFEKLDQSPALREGQLSNTVRHATGRFQSRIDAGDLPTVVNTRVGRRFDLDRQYDFFRTGDVARRLNMNAALVSGGGWSARHIGPIWGNYSSQHFSIWYPGPSWYPGHVWFPRWSPWVSWSYWNYVNPFYDPRPWIVRPFIYPVAQPIVVYDYPVWDSLPVVASGTWVDVPPVQISSGSDLQLLAVRFVDPGHPEQDMGPRYRAWVRLNGPRRLDQPFDVTMVATDGDELSRDMVQAGVTVDSIDANDTAVLDIRLPLQANRLVRANGHGKPFTHLHVIVDSHQKIDEADEANNGAVLARGDIYPVDPAAFSTDVTAAAPGGTVTIAGEGFGPEPGEVIVIVDDEEVPAEIRGWYELGVEFRLPSLRLNAPTEAEIVVVRGDGAASNPVAMELAPESQLGELPEAPKPR